MFNSEFYPTPRNVIDQMQLDCTGKICLEPSAGKGDIVDYLKEYGAAEVLACELNDDLRTIVANKATVIGSDFLSVTSEQISHVQLIVMFNTPSSGIVCISMLISCVPALSSVLPLSQILITQLLPLLELLQKSL